MKNLFNVTQLSFSDLYNQINESLADSPAKIFDLLDHNFAISKFISIQFHSHYYKDLGRNRSFSLESILNLLVFSHLFNIPSSKLLIFILSICKELRDFCGFKDSLPDEPFLSKFKDTFAHDIHQLFDNMVSDILGICEAWDDALSPGDTQKGFGKNLIYDTTGVEPFVKENNPKFIATEIRRQKQYAKFYQNKDYNAYAAAYSNLPKQAQANPSIKLDFVNGHFCYAYKLGLLTNGFGIPVGVTFFDDDFYKPFQNTSFQSPEEQKFAHDNASLRPALQSFLDTHANQFTSFLGDSEFDSYDNYTYLKNNGFSKVFIPINSRHSIPASKNGLSFDESGQPLCPKDSSPFKNDGSCKGKNRSLRFKKVCPKSPIINGKRMTSCLEPCTNSPSGRITYVYPDKDFRLFPGISRDSDEFINTYKSRTVIEPTISGLKSNSSIAKPKSLKIENIRVDFLFACIFKLVTLMLAFSLQQPTYFKNFTKLLRSS